MPKIVGIPCHKLGDNSFGAGIAHIEFVRYCGGTPRLLSSWEGIANVDAIYLPGGSDINPANYGEAPTVMSGSVDAHNEWFLQKSLPQYIEKGIPIFGVCLGFQMINVALGGSLHQHLTNHPSSPDRGEEGHDVYVVNNGLIEGKPFPVNSHHHQGIKKLGTGLTPIAIYYGDKLHIGAAIPKNCLVEAVVHNAKPIVGIQWHPEEWYDPFSVNLLKKLLAL